MNDNTVEFTNLSGLKPEALGEPGERTFRILVESGAGSAILWLEKEQLLQLAVAMTRLTAVQPEEEHAHGEDMWGTGTLSSGSVEFKIGKLVVGHDSDKGQLTVEGHDVEAPEDAPPYVRIWVDVDQGRTFAQEALRVCASGRPICPLCSGPMDRTGHVCPRANGHGLHEIRGL